MIFQEYALVERLTVMENVLSGRLGFVGFWSSFLEDFQRRTSKKHIDCLIEWACLKWQTKEQMHYLAGKDSVLESAGL